MRPSYFENLDAIPLDMLIVFFPDAVSSWNKLISHFTTMPPIGSFKSHIISLIRPSAKNTFKIHDPIGLRFLFRLRLNLSPLRSHKFHYNFNDVSSDICLCNQGVENTEHTLLSCPYYVIEREFMIRSVNNILQNYDLPGVIDSYMFYLYGHHLLGDNDNRSILCATIKFIKDTKRFTK